jgi:hypothetical protein
MSLILCIYSRLPINQQSALSIIAASKKERHYYASSASWQPTMAQLKKMLNQVVVEVKVAERAF